MLGDRRRPRRSARSTTGTAPAGSACPARTRPAGPGGPAASACAVMSSTIRTPWPSRSAPHHWIACQIDGSPNASPAWMVKCDVLPLQVLERVQVPGGRVARPRRRRCRSRPRPTSRYRTASSAISIDRAACRIAVSSVPTRIGVPAAAASRRARRRTRPAPPRPPRPASRPALEVLLGGEPHLGVDDAVRGQVLARTRPPPGAAPSGVCITADRVRERLQVALQRAGVGGVRRTSRPSAAGVGRGQPRARSRAASSTTVAGRSPPSRWSCSRTFGAPRRASGVIGFDMEQRYPGRPAGPGTTQPDAAGRRRGHRTVACGRSADRGGDRRAGGRPGRLRRARAGGSAGRSTRWSARSA